MISIFSVKTFWTLYGPRQFLAGFSEHSFQLAFSKTTNRITFYRAWIRLQFRTRWKDNREWDNDHVKNFLLKKFEDEDYKNEKEKSNYWYIAINTIFTGVYPRSQKVITVKKNFQIFIQTKDTARSWSVIVIDSEKLQKQLFLESTSQISKTISLDWMNYNILKFSS